MDFLLLNVQKINDGNTSAPLTHTKQNMTWCDFLTAGLAKKPAGTRWDC